MGPAPDPVTPATATTTTSSRLADGVLAELICRGVRDVVVCPGSRSQALALAAAAGERLGVLRLHVRVDERSAGFFALGIGRETGVPAAVIVTSGTAVANLLPAALEAFHARVPMILLSAERPEELRGVRANQTVQSGEVLGGFTRCAIRIEAEEPGHTGVEIAQQVESVRSLVARAVLAATAETAPGPVHVNIAFRDPLSGGLESLTEEIARGLTGPTRTEDASRIAAASGDAASSGAAAPPNATELADTSELDVYAHGADGASPLAVVIAGADAGAAAADFAHAAGLPLLAEPSSGARFGREAIQHWQRLLRRPELADAVERVIVFGHPTLTRDVPALIQRDGVETVVIDAAGDGSGVDRFNPGRAVRRFARTVSVAAGYDPAVLKPWLGRWVVADRALRAELTTMHEPDLEAARATGYKERNAYARAEVAALREPLDREHLTEAVWLATWPHDRLVVAASRLIRVLNGTAAPRNIRVHANRGLSGIDGTVATALGVATVSQAQEDPARAAGTTRVLIGDLALLHDAGSLLLPTEAEVESRPRIQLFVGNDGGGTIFDTLEAADTSTREDFERVMYTPQRANLASLAEAYGWEYRRVETRGELDRLLTAPVSGPMLVEVPLAR